MRRPWNSRARRRVVVDRHPGKGLFVMTAAVAPLTGAVAKTAVATIALDGRPGEIAVSPDSRYVYVATENLLQVVRTLDHHVATIPVPGAVKSVFVAADGTWVYARGYDGWLSIINTAHRTVCTVSGPASSDDVVSIDGKLLYAAHNSTDSWISAIDTDGRVVSSVPVDAEITGLAISPDGACLFATASERNTYYQYPRGALYEVDTRAGTVTRSIDIGLCPSAVTVSPDGRSAYVSHYDTRSVSAVDLTTGHVTSIQLDDAPLAVTMSSDSRRAYVTNERSVSVIDTATREVQVLIAGELPRGLVISPDGARVYVTDIAEGTVSVIDADVNTVAATVSLAGHPEAVAIAPHGLQLYVGDYWSAQMTVISASAADPRFELSPATSLLEIAS